MRRKIDLFRSASWIAVALLMSASCGLATLTFQLPSKSFSFDTSSSGWKAPPGDFPAVACGDGQLVVDCCKPPAPAPQPDCDTTPLACEGGVCVLEFPINVTQTIDLRHEVPELASVSGQKLASISISQVKYTIASTMNVELPRIDIFIAAQDGSGEKKFGSIPPTPQMTTQSGDVALDSGGQAAFSMYASSFSTPFNLVARLTMVVAPGSMVPSGRVNVTVTGTIKAKPNL